MPVGRPERPEGPAHGRPAAQLPVQAVPGAQPPVQAAPFGQPPVELTSGAQPPGAGPAVPHALTVDPRTGLPLAAPPSAGAPGGWAGDAAGPGLPGGVAGPGHHGVSAGSGQPGSQPHITAGPTEAGQPGSQPRFAAEPAGARRPAEDPYPVPGTSPAPGEHTAPGGSPAPSPSPGAPAPRNTHAPQTPLHAPDSVPTIDPRLAHALGRPQHGESVARRTGRSLRKLAGSAAQDVAEETRIARELQQPVTTGRVIAVTSIRGGVGKSTMAALLGRTFNHYRHDPVLTLEADAALGTLPVRMGADSVRWAAADLARILNPAMQLTDVTGYLVPVSDGGWLLPAGQGRVGAPLDIRTYRTVTLALRRYFAVTVVDCETLPGEVARTAMDTAHARVVVAPMTAEGVNGTRQVLDWLGQLPHSALSSTVVALTANSPDVTLDRATAVAHLKESGVHVVTVPYDRHLAQGGPIRTALLGQETRAAAITLAAEAMTRAVRMR